VVLVLYQQEASSSLSFVSFLAGTGCVWAVKLFQAFDFYDNSPFPGGIDGKYSDTVFLYHDPENGGLFRAYTAVIANLLKRRETSGCCCWIRIPAIDAGYLRALWLRPAGNEAEICCAQL